jgi:crotonobetainyl-CoA:carnitine CoA-transferase CaiB-like acyl-CoA transferase
MNAAGSTAGPLAGYTVIELARLAPGQVAGMLLADLGASVLRIEEPQSSTRGPSPAVYGDIRSHPAYAPNRGKRSIVIDLKNPAGFKIFEQLVEQTDVLLECFRPGVMDRLGAGYPALSRVNPCLVYCSLSGYGQAGPLRELPGHDINYISLAGLASFIGAPGRRGPVVPGLLIADFAGGSLQVALGIVSALLARERSGSGQYLDLAMVDGSMSLIAAQMAMAEISGTIDTPGDGRVSGGAPYYNFYETADGRWLSVGALEPYFWINLCKALGLEHLADRQNADGNEREQIFEALRQKFRERTRDEWVEYLGDKNTCVAPVLGLDELARHPQIQAREMVVDSANGSNQIGASLKLSATRAAPGAPPPARGQHTDEVLSELGLSPPEIADLRASGAVE